MSDAADHLDLIERLTDLAVGVDLDGTITLAGDGIERLVGCHRDEITGRPFGDLVHRDDRATWDAVLAQMADAQPHAVQALVRLLTSSGGWRWVELRVLDERDNPELETFVVAGHDVTDRRELEDGIERNDQLLTSLASNSDDVLMIVDATGAIAWISPAVERVFGYRVDELTGTSSLELIHPDDLELAGEKLGWILGESGRRQQTLWRARHADGSWRWVEATNINMIDDPAVGGIVASFRDVTDRRRTEVALQESEQRFRAVVQNSRDATALLALDGSLVWVSPSVQAMLGYAPEQMTGRVAFDYVHPDDLGLAMERLADVLASEELVDPVPLRLRHEGGGWATVEIAGSSLRDAHDVVEGIIINVRDIGWRVGAEQALRESEERFRSLVQNGSDVIVVISDANEAVYVSPSITRVFGHSVSDVTGASTDPWVVPEDLERIATEVAEIDDSPGATITIAYRVLDAERRVRFVEATVTNLRHESAVGGLVFNVRDITDRLTAERALQASEAMFRSVVDSSPLGLYMADDEGRCLYVNHRWEQITGLPAERAMGHGWVEMIHPDDLEWLLTDVGSAAFADKYDLTYRLLRPDGEMRWITVHTSPVRASRDDGVATVGLLEDITDRIGAEHDTQRLTDIFEATEDLIGIADGDGTLLYFNRAARRFFGLPLVGSVAHLNLADVFAPWAIEQITNEIEPKLTRDGIWSGELALLHAGGAEVPVSAQLLVHYDSDGNLEFFSGVMRDISERKAFEEQLAHQATHDPLTGLPNRVLLLDKLAGALNRARRHGRAVAVLFLDLDHFKVVNDSLGHGLGDRLLVAIAERLAIALRPQDTIARFGGDEFVLMCEDLDETADATAIARRVEQALSRPFEVDESEIYVGVSIGIAFSDRHSNEPETLIRDADAAMYRAKEKGRARFEIFDSAMRAHAVDRLDIENALRRALDRRELRVHYQPIVHLETGAISGVEALLRWEHPERGLLLPGEFIGIAEETGLIVPIGGWVLEQACRQVQRWSVEHPAIDGLVVTVNLSGRQLGSNRLVSDVETVLRETGVEPSSLDLEITESVLMDDVDMSAQTLTRLKALGVRLVVDDFGTGYSSLSYLRQFPVDVLKVDRSFVDGLGRDSGDTAIVAAIVNLAHTLGLHAIAEGVETPDQLRELRTLGCDSAQGFYLSRPVPPDALLDLFKAQPRF